MIAQVQRSIFQRWTNDRNSRAKVTIGQQDSQSRPNHWAAPRESKQARLVDGGFGRLAGHGGGHAASSRGRGDRQRAGCRSPWRGLVGRYDITPEDYLVMATHKTAHYSGAVPLAIGAIIGGGSEAEIEALRNYGLDTGLAFQIQDDLLNLVGDEESTQKDFRNDITEGKRTLMVVHALQHSEARDRLIEILSSKEKDPAVLSEAVDIMEASGSIDYARNYAENLTSIAKNRLIDMVQPSDSRDLLVSMADWFV